MVYRYDKKQKKYTLVGTNEKLPSSYAHLPPQNETDEEEMSDYVFLADIKLDRLLTLQFSQINYDTIFRGVDNQYKFQYRDHKMKLIGAELLNYSRARGDGFADSINYLSGKKESYEVVDVDKQVGKSTWRNLKKFKLIELEEFLYDDVY